MITILRPKKKDKRMTKKYHSTIHLQYSTLVMVRIDYCSQRQTTLVAVALERGLCPYIHTYIQNQTLLTLAILYLFRIWVQNRWCGSWPAAAE